MIYFDHSSTTSVRPEVVSVYTKLLEQTYGNPDSLHEAGRKASQQMEKARMLIAKMLHSDKEEIIFTGCASESNSLAVVGYALANKNRGTHIITSNSEHSSTKHAMAFLEEIGFDVTYLPVDERGSISAQAVKENMSKNTILVSVMHVNNEVGSINPIAEIADVVHQYPTAAFHSDCVQSFGKIDIPFEKLDMMTMSAHKIHGLKGSALLLKKKNIRVKPVIFGGQQEQGLRGGTENAPANIVLAKTIRLALEEQKEAYKNVSKINAYIKEELEKIPGAKILSADDALPYIMNIAFDQITSEVLLNALDQAGICVSAKSTCNSHDSGASEIILKMNGSLKDAIHSIRISFGKDNTLEEAKIFIQTVKEIIDKYGLPL